MSRKGMPHAALSPVWAILEVLRGGEQFCGADLIAEIRLRSNGKFRLYATAYQTMLRLVERGMIRVVRVDRNCPGRARRYFEITEAGRAAADEYRAVILNYYNPESSPGEANAGVGA